VEAPVLHRLDLAHWVVLVEEVHTRQQVEAPAQQDKDSQVVLEVPPEVVVVVVPDKPGE
jgi:hypothetical protein